MVKAKGIITDSAGDLLTRIRNAALASKRETTVPYSRLREGILKVLKKEGYLQSVKKKEGELIIQLTYKRRKPLVTAIKNVSSPGLRIYRKAKDIPRPLGGGGIAIISTSQGVMSSREAKKKNLGGEILGEIW